MRLDMSFLTNNFKKDMWAHLNRMVKLLPSTIPNITISEYAEKYRVLPMGTPYPGPWRNFRTPYLNEIMDCLSVVSVVQHVAVLKSAQIGLTAAAENVLGYWIGAVPSEIMFISATEDSVKKWAEKRLEPLIDSCGLREKLVKINSAQGSKASGDRTFQKTFIGGSLSMVSAQSATSLRSESKRILLRDEISGAPEQLRTGEGSWLEVSEARTNAWGVRKKIFDFSTPTLVDSCAIYKQYLKGDQRQFHVACPHCGCYQVLDWGSPKASHGMRAETKAGRLHEVYYQCEHCREAIFDRHKQQLLDSGYWVPQISDANPYRRSYHISGLYSPVGMVSFRDMWEKFQVAQETHNMRAFTNLSLGLPYRETGQRPKIEQVIELRGDYKSKTIPSNEVLFLTVGADVQEGSKKGDKNPARIELEVVGHGAGFKTWSIDYMVIEGAVNDPFDGAWETLRLKSEQGDFTYRRADGKVFTPQTWFIDSGHQTDVVYEFCRNKRGVYPCKGTQWLKKRKNEEGDVVDNMNFTRYRKIKPSPDLMVFLISTNYYKHQIYNSLNNSFRHVEDKTRSGTADFPFDREDHYFAMLTAEERRSDGSFHNTGDRRNEALDCRVYAMCACDVYLNMVLDKVRLDAKAAGKTMTEIDKITHKNVLDLLAANVAPKTA